MNYNPETTNFSNEECVDAKRAANSQPKTSNANCVKLPQVDGILNSNSVSRTDDRFLHDPDENGIGNCATRPVEPLIDDLYDHLKKVYHQKNHDYGNSFEDGLDEDGLIFAKMHLMEKYNRFKMLIKEQNKVKGEGIKDSLLDMANYAIMTVHWMNKHECDTVIH